MENLKSDIRNIIEESFKDTDYVIDDYVDINNNVTPDRAILIITRKDEPIKNTGYPRRAIVIDFSYIKGFGHIEDFGVNVGLEGLPNEDKEAVSNIFNSIDKKTVFLRLLYKKNKEESWFPRKYNI